MGFWPHSPRRAVDRTAELEVANRELLATNRELEAFCYSVSHDLRTPLTRLKLEAALAEPSPQVNAIKRDLAEMEHMIDEYLAFARGEGGEALETVRLRGLIQEVSEGATRAGAQVEVDADAALSASVRPNAFKRALSNLVMNAAVHGEHVAVAAHARPAGSRSWSTTMGPVSRPTATKTRSSRSTG